MHYITTADRETLVLDEEGEELSFATIDAALAKARQLSTEKAGRLIYVFDGLPSPRTKKAPRVRAYNGRAQWLVRCKTCNGQGVLAGQGGYYGPPACDKCGGSGYIDDKQVA